MAQVEIACVCWFLAYLNLRPWKLGPICFSETSGCGITTHKTTLHSYSLRNLKSSIQYDLDTSHSITINNVSILLHRVVEGKVPSTCGPLGMAAVRVTTATVTATSAVSTRCPSEARRSKDSSHGTASAVRLPWRPHTLAAPTRTRWS
jgi:hypothetical protein